MTLKQAINWKTLLIASLMLNVVLLAAGAYFAAELQWVHEQAVSPSGYFPLTNAAPGTAGHTVTGKRVAAAVAAVPAPQALPQ
jgi:hypothetical protein